VIVGTVEGVNSIREAVCEGDSDPNTGTCVFDGATEADGLIGTGSTEATGSTGGTGDAEAGGTGDAEAGGTGDAEAGGTGDAEAGGTGDADSDSTGVAEAGGDGVTVTVTVGAAREEDVTVNLTGETDCNGLTDRDGVGVVNPCRPGETVRVTVAVAVAVAVEAVASPVILSGITTPSLVDRVVHGFAPQGLSAGPCSVTTVNPGEAGVVIVLLYPQGICIWQYVPAAFHVEV